MALIIGGHPRSGTTLLRHLCNGHPDITLTHEFGNFRYLHRSYAEYRNRLLEALWNKGISENRNLLWSIENHRSSKLSKFVNSHAFLAKYFYELRKFRHDVIDVSVIESVIQRIFPKSRIVGDKEPHYVFELDALAEIRGLSCVIVYRDCRDVVSSALEKLRKDWRKKPWAKNFNSTEKLSRKWNESIELMLRNLGNIYTVRYENLVRQSKQEIESLSEWLGVDPSGFSTDIIRDSSIGKYKTRLNDDELTTIMEIAGPNMHRFGYS